MPWEELKKSLRARVNKADLSEAYDDLREHVSDMVINTLRNASTIEVFGTDHVSCMDDAALVRFVRDLDRYMWSEFVSGEVAYHCDEFSEDYNNMPAVVVSSLMDIYGTAVLELTSALTADEVTELANDLPEDQRVDFVEGPFGYVYDAFEDEMLGELRAMLVAQLAEEFTEEDITC